MSERHALDISREKRNQSRSAESVTKNPRRSLGDRGIHDQFCTTISAPASRDAPATGPTKAKPPLARDDCKAMLATGGSRGWAPRGGHGYNQTDGAAMVLPLLPTFLWRDQQNQLKLVVTGDLQESPGQRKGTACAGVAGSAGTSLAAT